MAMDNNSATVLIVGTTGHGKSLLANKLLRLTPNNEKGFNFGTRDCTRATTRESEIFSATIDELNLTVIDSPGVFDSETDISKRWLDILKAVLLAGGAIDAVIVVANSRRLHTAAVCFERLLSCIDIELHQTILVFTFVEDPSEEECRRCLREFNSHLTRGTLGLKFIFSDQLAAGDVIETKMEKIRSFVKGIMTSSLSRIDKTNFEKYTKRFLVNSLMTFCSKHISLSDLRNSPSINMTVIENFIKEDDINEIVQNPNRFENGCIVT